MTKNVLIITLLVPVMYTCYIDTDILILILWSVTLAALLRWGESFASNVPRTYESRAIRRHLIRAIHRRLVKNNNTHSIHWVIPVKLGKKKRKAFLDDGADSSLIAESLVTSTIFGNTEIVEGVGNGEVQTLGRCIETITLGGIPTTQEFSVLKDKDIPLIHLLGARMLLGMDWHQKYPPTKCYRKMTVQLEKGRAIASLSRNETPELKGHNQDPEQITKELIKKCPKLFDEAKQLPPQRPGLDCQLHQLKDKQGNPIRATASREIKITNPEKLRKLQEEKEMLLRTGRISVNTSESTPPCNAFCVVNPHDDKGNKGGALRVVYDFVRLNATLELPMAYLPRLLQVVRQVSRSKYFSIMDLRTGFHNLRMHPESAPLTAFCFPGDNTVYQWNVMPMGLSAAPACMQKLMRNILSNHLATGKIEIYLDDILIHAITQEEHDELLHQVLQTLEENNFHLKASKCSFQTQEVKFLGHTIGQGKCTPLHQNTQGIIDFAFPNTVQQWQRFHGMMNFYRLHVPRFADILRPIASIMGIRKEEILNEDIIKDEKRRLLAKAIKNQDPCLRTSFEEAKQAMENASSLQFLDFKRDLYLITDASKSAWAAVLTHDPTLEKEAPIAWLSGSFTKAEKHWMASEREIFAVIASIKQHPEFFGGHVHVLTDSSRLANWTAIDIS